MENLKKNIYKDYLFTLITRFDLTHGIWLLYLASKGLNLFQIGLMETIYHISSFLMEIPTGAVADIFGRKTSRILGRVSTCVAITIMIFGNNVIWFAVSFFFTALGNNLESGAGDALIYDSLKELNIENDYMKVRGRNELFFQIAKTFSLIIGGYIATLSYTSVYMIALVFAVISIIHAFSFTEPQIGRVQKKQNIWETFSHQVVSSFKVMSGKKELVEMIIALEIFSTFYTTEFFYMQNHLKSLGHSEFQIGIILSIGALLAAFTATQAYKLEARFKIKKILTVTIIAAVMLFWGMTINGVEKYAFIFLTAIEGLLFVVMGDYINKLIPSDKRATILSFQSMIFSLFMIVLFPIVGKLGDHYGLRNAFILVAVGATISLFILGRIIQKRNNAKQV